MASIIAFGEKTTRFLFMATVVGLFISVCALTIHQYENKKNNVVNNISSDHYKNIAIASLAFSILVLILNLVNKTVWVGLVFNMILCIIIIAISENTYKGAYPDQVLYGLSIVSLILLMLVIHYSWKKDDKFIKNIKNMFVTKPFSKENMLFGN